ncbi:hypothetical protein A2Y83_03005 [Candidatus Falkowbacteria bacterium RBG_13_39_14]|uniref:NADH:ubiquinone oxidoreductase-like 20kDa subunit domain-containing protein n=1 Tax=Candidatus Falkowbacteria bacterium RBG_13_39_14 TaxID=1797985 RepID=A0A1F5S0Z3_9BACT|nr:MAG: hypothetical protein A2Y83_03005 [Candidatus Falkowbacteria bacterium RBG_13_39_14]
MKQKPKIAIISLTSCEGCEIAVLDLGAKLLEALKNVELVSFKYMMEASLCNKRNELPSCDIAFVEGSPANKKDIELLKEVRKKAEKVIALGHCAHLGGVQRMKNYGDKEKIAKSVYKQYKKIENNDGGGIDKYIKVDGVIPGCPITKDEFLRSLIAALAGREFEIEESPVCYECLNNSYECLLQKGEICLGPVTLGGCGAICVKSGQACWGCRGFLPEVLPLRDGACPVSTNAKLENLRSKLKEIASEEDIEGVEEIFGLRRD